ncbi:blast:Cytochrome P450 9b2 [Drosophila guanche]|uniref:Blast:Cytochrome P450 9b2 n=1 Tax=Drosophila guanche TaxID=7266 RepID=A0A3B0JD03_DROGU|nr:blast:Cytochrome P450 9b2 [Drosophila guanche]
MVLLEICLAILIGAVLIYKWSTATHNAFDGRGIYFEKPSPFFGNMVASFLGRKSFPRQLSEFYQRTKKHKIVGLFSLRSAMIQLNDPEIIKKICIKDFDHFPNHQAFAQSNELLVNDMLTVMRDQRWKHMRNTLTPVFTAAKMRSMFALMGDSFGECLDHLSGLSKGTTAEVGVELDMKVLCNKLSNDLIATTAFGLKVNSFETPNNEFYQIGQSVTFGSGSQLFKFMLATLLPKVFRFFKLKIFDAQKVEYFVRLVVDAMKLALLCTTSLELLENPDIQQRLYEEVKEVQESLKGGPLTYDAVQKMKYMDMVISESLRKWTLAVATDRLCSKDYTLIDDDGTKLFEFKVGDQVSVPINALHWDEEYFPEPLKFDPERFSDERKQDIVPYTYLPFGVGPRNCIGSRYALMQVKGIFYNLLIRYKIERSPKTVKDLYAQQRGFTIAPKGAFWMRLVPRQ